ncbi:MAG: hypothetical protein WBE40_06350 [Thermoplasmata archaeon]
MANCQDVFDTLSGIRNRNLTGPLPAADLATLMQLNLVQVLTAEQYAQLTQELAGVAAARGAISSEMDGRSQLSARLQNEDRKTHSILFHFEGHDKQAEELQQEAADRARLQATNADLTAREQAFNQLVSKQSMIDTLGPYAGGYIGLTGLGTLAFRDLAIRLYRVSDIDFSAYWQQSQVVASELNEVAVRGSEYVSSLSTPLARVDRSYLWSIAIGLAKVEPNVPAGGALFLDAYNRLGPLSNNEENRLMSSEMLASLHRSIADNLPLLAQLENDVRKAGVPKESSLGVASVLLLGRREDGTFATPNLPTFLGVTRSYESAALLAIVNRPAQELVQKFAALRTMFAGWGFQPSEDVELSAAYLTLSDLPADGISTKLAIIAKGMGAYLQYPLVASSILASIPVLEANETLNLLEHAYEIVGARAMPMAPPELICLAVRMVHEVRNETVADLDTTATAAAVPAGVAYAAGPRFFFVPLIVVHGAYYSTFSGIGGIHPGHAHFGGGFVG